MLAVTWVVSQQRRGIKGTREPGLNREEAIVFSVDR
jgi:hypothetical protein